VFRIGLEDEIPGRSEVLIFGPRVEGDGELVPGFWDNA
jgi:hypothetical protein